MIKQPNGPDIINTSDTHLNGTIFKLGLEWSVWYKEWENWLTHIAHSNE